MKVDQQIIERLRELVKVPSIALPATVNSINKSQLTCTVTPLGGAKMVGVRLKAGIDELQDGLVEIPVLDSSVLVVIIGNQLGNAFVAKCSEVEEVLFYGGSHGGLIKVNELVKELEKVNQAIDTIKMALTTATLATPDGGEGFRLKMNADLAPIQTADYSNIENPKVKH